MSATVPEIPVADKLLLTPPEAAALLSCGYHTVLELIKLGPNRGGLASVPIGTQRRVPRSELVAWIASQAGPAAPAAPREGAG